MYGTASQTESIYGLRSLSITNYDNYCNIVLNHTLSGLTDIQTCYKEIINRWRLA